MKYLKYYLRQFIKIIRGSLVLFAPFILYIVIFIFAYLSENSDDFNLNPNDYCNLTEVKYTAILHDDPNGKANVEITEYITFDVHASSKSNPFKEVWRELPESTVDGLPVTYNVKSVTQILPDGKEIPYQESKKLYWDDSDFTKSATMRWHHSKGSGQSPDNYESLLIYIPWTYRDKLTYKIVYNMNNAALKYNDCSELYLSLYSGKTIKKLKSYQAEIRIPNHLMPQTYYAYSYGTSKDKIPFTESATLNPGYYTFSINLSKNDLKFDYHNRYIEFCLLAYGNDKHIFTKYAPNNTYSKDNVLEECIKENEYYEQKTAYYRGFKILLFVTSICLTILIVYKTKKKHKKIKEKNTFYKPEVDYEFFRDIPSDLDPLFATDLVFINDPYNENIEKQEEYAALLLSLVRKKYVTLTNKDGENANWEPGNTIITVNNPYNRKETIDELSTVNNVDATTIPKLEPLSTSEKLYFDLLERSARTKNYTISLKAFQTAINNDYEYTNAFVKNIEKKPALECGVAQGYYQQTEYDSLKKKYEKKSTSSMVIALLFLIVANFISHFTPLSYAFGAYTILGIAYFWKSIFLKSKSGDLVLFTQFGINEQAKWRGLYNFLNSDTLINTREVHELPLWEKYLIYATAFGISDKVIKAIKIHANELQINDSAILNQHCIVHASTFHVTSRAFGRSIHTSARGGGFGGHGYGGGGRGGGGGGGGH